MKTEDYKKRFIDLFKEMEEDLGKCAEVDIEHDNEIAFGREIVSTTYRCRIIF